MVSRSQPPLPGESNGGEGGRGASGEWTRVVDSVQTLVGALIRPRPDSVRIGLDDFERRCPQPRSLVERLMLKGILLDVLLQLQTSIQRDAQTGERRRAIASFGRPDPSEAIADFLRGARELVEEADHAATLPPHERARRWIDAHPEDQRTIAALAAELGTHPRTLSRRFTQSFATTLQQYRWKRRAARAAELLATTDLKVEAVADAVGMRSKSTLYRLMRRFGQAVKRPPS